MTLTRILCRPLRHCCRDNNDVIRMDMCLFSFPGGGDHLTAIVVTRQVCFRGSNDAAFCLNAGSMPIV